MHFSLPAGLSLRAERSSDKLFLTRLHHSTRDDLRLIDGEHDFIESIIEMQLTAQQNGYGNDFPDAMYYIIEYHNESVGRLAVAMGQNEVRVLDIAFIAQARGKGYGKGVLQALQAIVQKIPAPLTLSVMRHNVQAVALYTSLGFVPCQASETHMLMEWVPQAQRIFVGKPVS